MTAAVTPQYASAATTQAFEVASGSDAVWMGIGRTMPGGEAIKAGYRMAVACR